MNFKSLSKKVAKAENKINVILEDLTKDLASQMGKELKVKFVKPKLEGDLDSYGCSLTASLALTLVVDHDAGYHPEDF